MTTSSIKATALLAMTTKIRTRAARHAAGFQIVWDSIGHTTARWAYADRGDGPGQRQESAADKALKAWTPSSGDWCRLLMGITGIGKTISAARYVADRGGQVVKAEESDAWGFDGGPRLRQLQAARWLMIDDLGDERTPVGTANVQKLLTHRAASSLATVGTTTLLLAGDGSIESKYGDHLHSRLRAHYVSLVRSREPDRRSTIVPLLSGFQSEQDLAWAARDVQLVRDEIVTGPEAVIMIERFALLAKIDMECTGFRAEAQAAAEHLDRMEALTATAIEQWSTSRESTEVDADADDELLDWVDGI